MENSMKPFDALNDAKEKKVLVELKGSRMYSGTLKAFDQHINIVLDDVSEVDEGQVTKNLGRVFLRGDTIISISPE